MTLHGACTQVQTGMACTWYLTVVCSALRLHEARQARQQAILATQLLPQLHNGVKIIGGQLWHHPAI